MAAVAATLEPRPPMLGAPELGTPVAAACGL
jgi:hypothetical protein